MARTNRPQPGIVLSVLPFLLVTGCTRGPSHSSSRTFEFRYTASLANLPTHAKQVRIWIPLAKTRENQQVLTRQVRTSSPYDIHEEAVYGNDILYLALSPPIPQPVDVVVDYAVTVHSGRPLDSRQLFHASEAVASADESLGSASPRSPRAEHGTRCEAGRILSLWSPPGKPGAPLCRPSTSLGTTPRRVWGDIPSEAPPAKAGARVEGSKDELALALRDEPLMVVNEHVTRLAKDATAGRRGELQKMRAIYDYVIAHMSYDKTVPGWGRGDTLRACLLGKGNCTDFHSLFISMGRSIGIPARFVIGASIPQEPAGEIPGYHCWAEFYSPEYGWVPVDASEAWKHPQQRDDYFGTQDPNKLLISAGRNLQLVPAQAGPPVNIFVYPYVEVDGVPFEGATTRFEFTSRKSREAKT